MYHITRTKSKTAEGRFQVVNVSSANHKVINTSEPLNTIQACHKNIIANMDTVYAESDAPFYVSVQDDTRVKPIAYRLYDDGEKEFGCTSLVPRYIPGKNKKKKARK